jgi:pimeloyl-ACP methyl ester carboxylesterase
MIQMFLGLTVLIAVLSVAAPTRAQDHPTYGVELEGFDYPHDVNRYRFRSQGSDVSMAYMDVKPGTANGRTAVLLHGRNFCAATWEKTITVLSKAGFRVTAPDQIGFCKSTKPLGYQFSIQQLATNTNALLTSLGVSRPIIIGHSFGRGLYSQVDRGRPRYGVQQPRCPARGVRGLRGESKSRTPILVYEIRSVSIASSRGEKPADLPVQAPTRYELVSTSRPQRRSASTCRRRCSPAPTR